MKLELCGDKGLSVGEKSLINLDKVYVNKANMGLAVKDSSIVKLNSAILSNIQICVAAYKKKQEYEGGLIKIENMNCDKYYKKAEIDDFSKITSDGLVLNNNSFGKTYDLSKLKVSNIKGGEIFKNSTKDHEVFNKDKTFNAIVEVSAGMREKWEVSKLNGSLVREFYMGVPRTIDLSPYPVNYGMIPRTVLPISRGGIGIL